MPRIVATRLPDSARELMADLAGLEAPDLAEVERLLMDAHRCGLDEGEEALLGDLVGTTNVERTTLAYEALTGRRVRAPGAKGAGQGAGRERSRRVARDTRGLR